MSASAPPFNIQHIQPGPRNLITDVDGVSVGNIDSSSVRSGVTVVMPDVRAVAACDVRGGAPGTRETDALDPAGIATAVDAVVLSGGSTYGLEAASGAVAWLGERDRGFRFGTTTKVSPVVPSAILFDLANEGDKKWGGEPPYGRWGRDACAVASREFALGNAGAGMGAVAGNLKGGLGSASAITGNIQAGAIVAVNAFGSTVIPGARNLWAAPFEMNGEFGGVSANGDARVASLDPFTQTRADVSAVTPGGNTTIGVIAVNVALTPTEAKRIAVMAQDGLARAIRPVHSQVDGDILFVLSTARVEIPQPDRLVQLMRLGSIVTDCVTRAIGRAMCAANDLGAYRCYRSWLAGRR
jgi:L-aminopeptidase/D-esterase-like protein